MYQSVTTIACGLLFMMQTAEAGLISDEMVSVTESSIVAEVAAPSAGIVAEVAAPSADATDEESVLSSAADASPQMSIMRRVQPRWPMDMWGWRPVHETCVARIDADIDGVPYNVVISGCSESFHGVTEQAALKFRFYPLLVDGVPEEATTSIKMTFHRD
jgi:hypothetical protein